MNAITRRGWRTARRRTGSAALPAWLGILWLATQAGPERAAAAPSPTPGPATPARIDFNRQIRPLLSDKCFTCHGPDEKGRKGKVRLDRKEDAFKPLAEGKAILAPGQPERSALYQRITAADPQERMPPPETKRTLTQQEIDLVRRWIEQGAEYKAHWSFVPLERVPVPNFLSDPWVRNPIDAFVLERLRAEHLSPAGEAPLETLVRRAAFDLTGLPPTLSDLDEAERAPATGVYERLVERFLGSPAYGERMANDWLDLARYADTYGYQSDVDRDVSPWRDWVIRAFNSNLPYDVFLLWQLAGDLLPAATREQIVATAFNRLHRQTNEGGSIEEEFRTEYVADRVHTMGTALLGLTLECSRCHDHKYDPIQQADYYRLFAFFNNLDESGLYSHFTQATPTPTLLLYNEEVEARHRALQAALTQAEQTLQSVRAQAAKRFLAWNATRPATLPRPQPSAAFAFDVVEKDQTPNTGPTTGSTNRPATLVEGPLLVPGRRGKALQFDGDNALVCQGRGEFDRTQPFSFSLWLRLTETQARAVVLHRSRAWTDSGSRGYELVLDQGHPSFNLIHFWPGNALGVRAKQPLPLHAWNHLAVTYDGSSRAAGLRLYLNGQPAELEVVRDNLFKDILHRKEWGDSDVGNIHLTLAGRFRDSGLKNGIIDEFEVFDRALSPGEIKQLACPTDSAGDGVSEADWLAWYVENQDPEYREALEQCHTLRRQENALVNDVRELMVMRELPQARPTFRLNRGAYDAPAERVEAGTPPAIFPMPPEYPRNRLGLARWMADRRNPLVARVAVNRVWRMHFGRGLVATVEDFGSQGQAPTHPELLDWLALWFIDHGWDRKALHRLILASSTYRQSSQASAAQLAADPDNRWLSRGPAYRLAAEQLRDQALAVSGLLTAKLGGPSVKPYQPAGLWEESGTGKSYHPSKGEDLCRRSLYTFWRRTAPPPSMLTFDATSREVCTAKRETTATPLQALVLLNDPQFIEASRVLGETLVRRHPGDLDARITDAFRLLTGRRPRDEERRLLAALYREQLERFRAEPEAARSYVAIGEAPSDPSLPLWQVAATAVLANSLLNYDESVMKR